MRIITPYTWHTGKLTHPVRLLVVSDLHNEPFDDLLPMLARADALLVPGDISDRYRKRYELGVDFLKEASKRLPTFFSVGNHETKQPDYRRLMDAVAQTDAVTLVNRYVRFGELVIGGWYDPAIVRTADMLPDFEAQRGCRVLMCHKPNHYFKYLRGHDIDLVIAGHAHGGQIRVGRQGLFSPGQGLLPRYTRGVIDGRMIVSAGVGNPNRLPRWNNPEEALLITLD